MSKKSFDHIENKIREAAENSEPLFNELAWSNMEALLIKDNGKKRRYFFGWILFSFIFVGAGSAYMFYKNRPVKEITAIYKEQKSKDTTADRVKNITGEVPVFTYNQKTSNNKATLNKPINSELEYANSQSPNNNNDSSVSSDNSNENSKKIRQIKKGKLYSNVNLGQVESTDEVPVKQDTLNSILVLTHMDAINENTTPVVLKDSAIKIDSIKIGKKDFSKKNKNEKITVEKLARFYILAAIGGDAGSVKFLSFKKSAVTVKYGIGIGYQLNNKISVQTGFYASQKKYIAGPEDYYTKNSPYWNYKNIVKVDANCLVYDIPLSIRYNFLLKPATIYYTTTGLSTFIMKRENYDYYYTYTGSTTIYHKDSTYTGNKNLFSVFNFSIGIQKKLSPNFSILAEPLISIPLSGVGQGQVKLYSTALQLAIKYQLSTKHK